MPTGGRTKGPKIDPATELTKVCRVCGVTAVIKTQKGVPLSAYTEDPFCSSDCAREFYGNPFVPGTAGRKRKWNV